MDIYAFVLIVVIATIKLMFILIFLNLYIYYKSNFSEELLQQKWEAERAETRKYKSKWKYTVWVTARQNQQYDLCTQRSQSAQSLRFTHQET